MAKRRDYSLPNNYLINSNQDIVKLTFNEIEEILGFDLAPSVRTHRPNWSNKEHET